MERIFRAKPLFLVRVTGESGWPHLIPGKTYIATSLRRPSIGDFVVFPNPKDHEEMYVKRVSAVQHEGYEVESSVSWGASSKDFGVVKHHEVLGSILWKLS